MTLKEELVKLEKQRLSYASSQVEGSWDLVANYERPMTAFIKDFFTEKEEELKEKILNGSKETFDIYKAQLDLCKEFLDYVDYDNLSKIREKYVGILNEQRKVD